MPRSQKASNNLLLQSLPQHAYALLAEDLEELKLGHMQVLSEPQDEIRSLYFPGNDVLLSLISTTEDDETAEVAIVGWEGMVGYGSVLGQKYHAHRCLTQMHGEVTRISVKPFLAACEAEPVIQRLILRYVEFLISQVSQTALCNRLHGIEERLARWLLMSDDRVESDQLPFTHEVLSHMLGSRRSTVSLTAATLQSAGLIEYNRGKISIVDRKGLESAACTCYPVMAANLKSLVKRTSG